MAENNSERGYLAAAKLLLLGEERELDVLDSDELGVALLVLLDEVLDLAHLELPGRTND
jgi:hypothetical protein